MNRKNFLKSLLSGTIAVVAAPLVGRAQPVLKRFSGFSASAPGQLIEGHAMTTLRSYDPELVCQTELIRNVVLPPYPEDLKKAEDFYEWMQEVTWEGLSC